MFRTAESYFEERNYQRAQPLYEKVIERSCNESSIAYERLQAMSVKHPHVLTCEFALNTPFGISSGNYKDHKVSGYFTLRFNSELFELLRTAEDEKLKPELNVSFGWTVKVIKPVWVFFGPGYTGVGKYIVESDDDKLKLKINHAISPEVGLLGKIVLADKIGIALRYTFQYRFALEKENIDYIGKTRHVLGIGFCF
jgi:hypothetical protein